MYPQKSRDASDHGHSRAHISRRNLVLKVRVRNAMTKTQRTLSLQLQPQRHNKSKIRSRETERQRYCCCLYVALLSLSSLPTLPVSSFPEARQVYNYTTMLHVWRMLGDGMHALSVLMFLVIVGVKGNGSGISLKSQVLYLLVFMSRYLDLFTTFYSWYNTLMKVFFLGCTVTMISILVNVEPARSTYSMAQDSCNHWNLVIGSAVFAMIIHLVGSGVVDIKGGSGQEFEVHLEHYSWLSYLWTFSVCLEPLAMVPQLYIFFKNRLLNRDIRLAIFFMGVYRIFYLCFWVFRARVVSQAPDQRHHLLLYFSGGMQVLVYFDFFVYHWR